MRKENLAASILYTLYVLNKIFTSYSIQQYIMHDYYHAVDLKKERKKELVKKRRKIQKSLYYLKQAGFVNIDKNKHIKLTDKGLLKVIFNKIQRYKRNGKRTKFFYLIIFDIPEELRRIRNLFRRALYNLGADRLQKSAFVVRDIEAYKYIKELVYRAELSTYVKLIVCKKLDN